MDGRIHFGSALSGRDIEAVRKTVSGLVKLLYPNPSTSVPDVDLEWTALGVGTIMPAIWATAVKT
jgi:ATP-dependent Lon protease